MDKYEEYPKAPTDVLDRIREYADDRRPPSTFVAAVLENDLAFAMRAADPPRVAGLYDIVRYVRWEIPAESWGSIEKVDAWLRGLAVYHMEGWVSPGVQVAELKGTFDKVEAYARDVRTNQPKVSLVFANLDMCDEDTNGLTEEESERLEAI